MPKTAAARSKPTNQPKAPAGATVGSLHVPAMYGGKKRDTYMPWSRVEERLAGSRNYWICTARRDGRPHSSPVWGFWHEGAFYFGTHRDTRKARNITHNPSVSVHLESGDDVVILEGRAEEVDQKKLAKELDAVARKKYGMPMMIVHESVAYRVRPRLVFAWTEKDFPKDSTRWEFTV
jgi:PPOX class probable F420-dependent enzyme